MRVKEAQARAPGRLIDGIFAPVCTGVHPRSPHLPDSASHLCTAVSACWYACWLCWAAMEDAARTTLPAFCLILAEVFFFATVRMYSMLADTSSHTHHLHVVR
jgi:hypothetical protein